jgi:hypothetical protein
MVGPSLTPKYTTRMEVTESGKHSSLLDIAKITAVKSFTVQGPVFTKLYFLRILKKS